MQKKLAAFALCSALAGITLPAVVHAEFRIVGQADSVAPVPLSTRSESRPLPARAPFRRQRSGQALAVGFGRQVPLAFAVRQIVPKDVAVTYSSDLDADSVAVDWQGGLPWPDALRALLRKPGLLVTFRPGSALISRHSG